MKLPKTRKREPDYNPGCLDVAGVWDPKAHKLFPLIDRQKLSFGRHRDCDVQINDEWVSALHCELEQTTDGRWVLHDQSRNGTFVNDVRVVESMPLTVGMYIQIGERTFVIMDLDNRIVIKARGVRSFLAKAFEMYGSMRKAGTMVGKSHMTVGRAYRARFPKRLYNGKKRMSP